MLAYYNCKDCNNAIVQESAVFISDDLVHDAHAVQHFTKQFDNHLRNNRGVVFDHEVQFSDGCSGQYKSKLPFQHLTETTTHHFERSYFGSRHGKGPCDALGGVVKKAAESYVKSRKGTIRDAKELFQFCESHLKVGNGEACEHKRRVFFYLKKINRKGRKSDTLRTFEGTRQLHSIQAVQLSVVRGRNLSCFCDACTSGNEPESCTNKTHVGGWKIHHLGSKNRRCKSPDNCNQEKKKPSSSNCHDLRKTPPEKPDNPKHNSSKQQVPIGMLLNNFRKAKNYEELKLLAFSHAKDIGNLETN